MNRLVRAFRAFTRSRAWASSKRCFACNSFFSSLVIGLPPFLPDQVIAQHIGQLHDLLIANRFSLELGGQVGNTVRPAVFLMEPVNQLLHGISRPDDLCLDFVAYRHHQKSSYIYLIKKRSWYALWHNRFAVS